MVSCSGGPRKKMEFVVVSITLDVDPQSQQNEDSQWVTNPGWRHNLREVGTNQPAFVHYPEVRFAKGDRVIMKRTRRSVKFELAVQPIY